MLRLPRQVSCIGESSTIEDSNFTSYLAQAYIPDVGKGATLEIGDEKNVLWQRKAPKKASTITNFTAKVDKRGKSVEIVRLNWKVSGPVQEFWLRWSTDKDKGNWRALSTNLKGTSARLDSSLLPPGKVLLQVVAHDGFFSSYSKTVSIRLPQRLPEVSILHPVDGYTYVAGQTLRLWGVTTTAEGKTVSSRNITWLLGRRKIGHGLEQWISPDPGDHKLTLRVRTKSGVSEASIGITVVSPNDKGDSS